MISLLVDEAYAFDYLAILEVKNNLYPSEKKLESYLECKEYLSNQLSNFIDIYTSIEYKNLYDINKITFNLIDELRNGTQVSAKTIDDANMERYFKKKALQEKFFINQILKEEKITK